MSYNSQELAETFADLIDKVIGNHADFDCVDAVENATPSSLVFVESEGQAKYLQSSAPAVVVTNSKVADAIQAGYQGMIVCVDNVRLAQAKIKQVYNDYQSADLEWDAIHSSALIHKSAILGKGVRLGPNVVVGENCKIGANSVIRANSVLEHDTVIGEKCIVNSLVNIGYGSVIGNNVNIHSGTVLGNEGFGFASDNDKRYHRIPQTGNVEIGDDVQIGSNCNIDRGTYSATRIERGVKIDALCHIAHNVLIKEDAIITAQCVIAGSSTIGKRAILSGQTGVLDHVCIADDAVLVHRCGVTENITEAGMWAGTPAKPWREYVVDMRLAKKVKKLEDKIKQLKQTGE